jgi:hypothetical protein
VGGGGGDLTSAGVSSEVASSWEAIVLTETRGDVGTEAAGVEAVAGTETVVDDAVDAFLAGQPRPRQR